VVVPSVGACPRRVSVEYVDNVVEITHPPGTIYAIGIFSGWQNKWRAALAETGPGNPVAAIEFWLRELTVRFTVHRIEFEGRLDDACDVGVGYDIRTVQELLGHRDVKTTMIYRHVLNRGGRGVESPADRLLGGHVSPDGKPTAFRITDEARGVGEEELDAFTEFLDGTGDRPRR